jgi:hypothetical protein
VSHGPWLRSERRARDFRFLFALIPLKLKVLLMARRLATRSSAVSL